MSKEGIIQKKKIKIGAIFNIFKNFIHIWKAGTFPRLMIPTACFYDSLVKKQCKVFSFQLTNYTINIQYIKIHIHHIDTQLPNALKTYTNRKCKYILENDFTESTSNRTMFKVTFLLVYIISFVVNIWNTRELCSHGIMNFKRSGID